MNCLSRERIFFYLEGGLSPEEKETVGTHLKSCGKCREVVKDEQIFLQSARSLENIEVPEGFAQDVMARVLSRKSPLFGWLAAGAAGLSSFLSILLVSALVPGQSFTEALLSLNHHFLQGLRNGAVLSVKFIKFILLSLELLWRFFRDLLKGGRLVAGLVGPEVQFILLLAALAVGFSLIYGMRKYIPSGEKP